VDKVLPGVSLLTGRAPGGVLAGSAGEFQPGPVAPGTSTVRA
jgi:hypothetical protein